MLDEVLGGVDGISCEKWLLQGTPWRSIVALAERENVDLIVLGTHGRTGLLRVLMGSVAEAIVRHATCPVLTIRQGAQVTAKVT
jgi:nucleotide-binding universal stress UspA family protein